MFDKWYLIPDLKNVLTSKFACKKKVDIVGKIQVNKSLKQKHDWMEGGLFCKLFAQTKITLTRDNTPGNIMIILSLIEF